MITTNSISFIILVAAVVEVAVAVVVIVERSLETQTLYEATAQLSCIAFTLIVEAFTSIQP